MMGVMASSERSSQVWFAPAGFNRGGLSDGAAGIPISNVSQRLSSKERDTLYDARINPIASFPKHRYCSLRSEDSTRAPICPRPYQRASSSHLPQEADFHPIYTGSLRAERAGNLEPLQGPNRAIPCKRQDSVRYH